jgi:GT2 family glycosyltransferase
MPELSVVIATLGNYSGLRRVLDSLEAQDAPPHVLEVIVVVDVAEPDPAAAAGAIGERRYDVRRLRGRIPGASSNRNVGWSAAEAPIVLFMDNDTLAQKQLVSEHLAWHRRHQEDEVAVLGHVRWARELRVTPFMHWLDHGMQFDFPSIEGVEAGWGRFYSANVSVKKRLLERVGGFDEERLPYLYEDLDFGYRASKLGLRLLYDRRAVVEHLREMDLEYWKRRMEPAARAERAFVRKHPEIPPYFHRMLSRAAGLPQARGRGARFIRLVPRWVPWLGPRVWISADLYFRQALAPHFLAAWERASDSPKSPDGTVAPHLLDHDAVR